MSVLDPSNRWHRLLGLLRLSRSYCPRCNSDAPAVDTCTVCKEGYERVGLAYSTPIKLERSDFPVNHHTKALWWANWMYPWFEETQNEIQDTMGEAKEPKNPALVGIKLDAKK